MSCSRRQYKKKTQECPSFSAAVSDVSPKLDMQTPSTMKPVYTQYRSSIQTVEVVRPTS
jgi:hypothetical protein